MNQWRIVLAVVIVALGSGALWLWHEGSQSVDATPAPAQEPAPVQQSSIPAPVADQSVASAATPSAPSAPPAQPTPAASEVTESATSAAVEPPNVDTPEPAERKFASGGRPDPEQN